MLFKYLIGTVALAAIVASSPTDSSSGAAHLGLGVSITTSSAFYTKQKSTYQKCVTTIKEVKEPVITNTQYGKVEEVKKHLKKVYQPVLDISLNFNTVSSVEVEKTVIKEQTSQFIEVLKSFQEVLVVIAKVPTVSSGCHDVFIQLNAHFKTITTQFKSHGVNIHKTIKESGLSLTVWDAVGLDFHHESSTW